MDSVAVELPPELQIDILLRLPVKSLSRFRCVCRAWNAAITSRRFISLHEETRSLRDTSLLLLHYSLTRRKALYTVYRDDESPPFTDIQHIDFPVGRNDTYFFIASCNGLLCFSDNITKSPGIVLCNPSIRKSVKIPNPRFIEPNFYRVDFLGFGFDCKTNDYKVVRFIYDMAWNSGMQVPVEVEIFELSRFKWRSVTIAVPHVVRVTETSHQVFVNGGVHWIGWHLPKPNIRRRSSPLVVVVFDVQDEHFTELETPSGIVKLYVPNLSPAVCGESLCMLQMNPWIGGIREGDYQRGVCCIWVMNKYGVNESWTRQFNVDMRGLGDLGRVLGFRKHGEILVVNRSDELVSYDPVNRGIRNLGLHGVLKSFQVMNYMESLVLLDCREEEKMNDI